MAKPPLIIYRGYGVKRDQTDSGVFTRIFKDGIRVHALPMDANEDAALAWIDAEKKKALDNSKSTT